MRNSAIKRMIGLMMAMVLFVGLMAPAAAADSAVATTLRLDKAEGTVTVSNASGKAQTIKEGMRLYSGYTVTTGIKSGAYVSLDGSKAIKLDSSSSAEIRKSGKKLEVFLKSGNLLFDVSEPLKSDESLNIRTATMVTGVRGTVGYVRNVDRSLSFLYLLEGRLEVNNIASGTGTSQTATLVAGQAIAATKPDGEIVSDLQSMGQFSGDDLPGFVCDELAKNEPLRDRVENAMPSLPMHDLVYWAPERVETAQAKQEQLAAALAQQIAQQPAPKQEPLYEAGDFVDTTPTQYTITFVPIDDTYYPNGAPDYTVTIGQLVDGEWFYPERGVEVGEAAGEHKVYVPAGAEFRFMLSDGSGSMIGFDGYGSVSYDSTPITPDYEGIYDPDYEEIIDYPIYTISPVNRDISITVTLPN